MKIFRIDNAKMPWGDYGSILLTGLLTQENGKIKIRRAGPYVPPIVICGINTIIVTDTFKNAIENSGLTGFNFRQVEIQKIVNINWTTWNLTAEDPEFYPESGEPEDYLEENENDESLLRQMQRIWVMDITNNITVELAEGSEWWIKIPKVKSDSWKSNFGITDNIKYTFIDEKAKDWLTNFTDGKIEFQPIEIV